MLQLVSWSFSSFKTWVVMANLGALAVDLFSSFSLPFKMALSISGLKFVGAQPLVRCAVLRPDRYWETVAAPTFFISSSQPT